jgi:hypothetical protein
MSRHIFLFLIPCLLIPASAFAQKQVQGPRKVTSDSIEVTVTGVRLRVANEQLDFANAASPTLYPTGSREAQIWFSIGFMLDSCRIQKFERVESGQAKSGTTTNNLTFRCHYKASEFRSAINDLMD